MTGPLGPLHAVPDEDPNEQPPEDLGRAFLQLRNLVEKYIGTIQAIGDRLVKQQDQIDRLSAEIKELRRGS